MSCLPWFSMNKPQNNLRDDRTLTEPTVLTVGSVFLGMVPEIRHGKAPAKRESSICLPGKSPGKPLPDARSPACSFTWQGPGLQQESSPPSCKVLCLSLPPQRTALRLHSLQPALSESLLLRGRMTVLSTLKSPQSGPSPDPCIRA